MGGQVGGVEPGRPVLVAEVGNAHRGRYTGWMAAVAAPASRADRADLRRLLARTNRHAAALLAAHAAVLVAGGVWVWAAIGSWWVVPAAVADGIVVAHLFAVFHECCHRTAFRWRPANHAVAWVSGLVIGLPP